jgi:hypothetical protein
LFFWRLEGMCSILETQYQRSKIPAPVLHTRGGRRQLAAAAVWRRAPARVVLRCWLSIRGDGELAGDAYGSDGTREKSPAAVMGDEAGDAGRRLSSARRRWRNFQPGEVAAAEG